MRIAFAGNPNSGKTTMFNALTGRSEKVGNWAGVTVDKKEFRIKKEFYDGEEEMILVDLPGAYSLSPYTSEESITRDYVFNEKPDVIVNIVDSTNLSRSLFFTSQLLELGVPVAVALNKTDLNEKKKNLIDEKLLSEKLGCPVVKTSAVSKSGLAELIKAASFLKGKIQITGSSQDSIDLSDRKSMEESNKQRFAYVSKIVSEVEKRKSFTKDVFRDDRIDKVLTHPFFGVLIFAVIMFLVFYISQAESPLGLGKFLEGILSGLIENFQVFVGGLVENANPLLKSILLDGIIGGVGAVVGFLPLVMVMYFLIALLEDSGYMARATVVLDPIFKRVGLSGKSVIPMVIGTGCGVPAIMACKTIKNEKERRTTALLCTFMPCGAKLPVIALFAGAFFPESVWVGPAMYFLGIAVILLGALIIKNITGVTFKKNYFIIELPEYKIPSLKFAVKNMIERGKSYIIKAGTIILLCNTIVQVMASFTLSFSVACENGSDSILAFISSPFAVLLIPVIGFSCWQFAAASITGFIAKENVVGTLATIFALTNFIDTQSLELTGGADEVALVLGLSKVSALAYLVFNLFTPPCFAALGAMNSEMKSKKWLWGAIGFQFATGFSLGFLVFQIGTFITTGSLGCGFFGGLAFVILFATTLVLIGVKNKNGKKQND